MNTKSLDNGKGKLILHALSAMAGIIVIILIGSRTGFSDFLDHLRQINGLVLLPLIAVYSISWIMRGLRFKRILGILNCRTGFLKAIQLELVSDLANQVLPAKLGDSLKVIYLHRAKMLHFTGGTFAAFLVRVMDLTSVTLLALFSVVFVSGTVASGYLSYIIAMLALILVITCAGWLFMRKPSAFARLLPGPLARFRGSVTDIGVQARQNPGELALVLLESMLVWVFDIMTLFVFLLAFNIELSFAETAFVLLLSNLMKALPLTPNGLGVYEGMMVVILTGFKVAESTAFSIAVLDHGFMNIYSFIIGILALYGLGLGVGKARELLKQNTEENNDRENG